MAEFDLPSRRAGVRYVLEGSVRRAANRVRIIGQLIDALAGAHLGRTALTAASNTSLIYRTR